MSDDLPLLEVQGVWKKYARSLSRSLYYGAVDSMRELGNRRQSDKLRDSEFWSVKDVSFSLRRGEALGVCGQNGAGKTTLLRLVSGMLKPDKGQIVMRGRLEKLMDFSAGFKPMLTGRENVRLRARLAGLRDKQIRAMVDEIVDFAELDEFIDSPLEFYSSGMRARLGFATCVMSKPDILIIDEVLAVGDLGFKMKCYERLDRMMDESAVLFVSHSMNQVSRVCTHGAYMNRGEMLHIGDVQEAIRLYNDQFGVEKKSVKSLNPERLTVRYGVAADGGAPVALEDGARVPFGARWTVELDAAQMPADASYRVVMRDLAKMGLQEWNSLRSELPEAGGDTVVCELGTADLSPGRYTIEVVAMAGNGRDHLAITEPVEFAVEGDYLSRVAVQKVGSWRREAMPTVQQPKPVQDDQQIREAGA